MNCKGCVYQMKSRPECCFTKSGILSLNNCLCELCLIKPMCSSVCSDFSEMLRRDPTTVINIASRIATFQDW